MRVFRWLLCLFFVCGSALGATYQVKMTADNFYAVYTGSATAANTLHFQGSWSAGVGTPSITTNDGYLYVVAWDDGEVYQGLLATIQSGGGIIATGSPLWQVCAANQTISAAPAAGPLSAKIASCTWTATTNGPNNGNAASAGLWGSVGMIDATANWIWHTNASAACAGTNGFLKGPCNPGEYLIFRLPLERVAGCLPPVPDFTIDWNAGFGMLQANGTNSQHELSHFWSVEESDASWNRYPPEITQWFTGPAGIFDLKTFYETGSKKKLQCDKYYRVKLAVGNNCINWRDITKLVRIKCCPGEVISPRP